MGIKVTMNAKTGQVTEREMTTSELRSMASTKEQIRHYRNQLLATSDWTQIADAPVDQSAWATYRQALRDVPEQEGFPENVIWPTPPE